MACAVWGIAVALAAFAGFFTLCLYRVVIALGQLELRPAADLTPEESAEVQRHGEWAAAHGFEPVGVFRTVVPGQPPVLVAAWRFPGLSTYFCMYQRQRVHTDRVTHFRGGTGIATSSSAAAFQLPMRPGMAGQAYPGATLDELWNRHLEAEEHFVKRLGFQFEPAGSFEQQFTTAMRAQSAHVRSMTLWPLRMYVWLMTAHRHVNRPVTVLHPHQRAPARTLEPAGTR